MTRKALVFFVVLQGACTAGPDQAFYRGPAFTLNARFADPSAPEFSWLEVNVEVINFSTTTSTNTSTSTSTDTSTSITSSEQQPDVKRVVVESTAVPPLVGGSARIELSGSGATPQEEELTMEDELRFLRVTAIGSWATASSSYGYGSWTLPGYDLIHAQVPTTFCPYGPSGPTVEFPEGYSWLRHTCGATPGLMEMTVAPPEETVDFHYEGSLSDPMHDQDRSIEESEQALVEGCGVPVPAVDLGTRVSFDHAQEMVWSADGNSIFYLAPADPQDRTQSVSLRQVRLTDAATDEVVVIPFGRGLQDDRTGQLYVGNANNLLRVDLSSGASAALMTIPIPPNSVLSPNGRWLAYDFKQALDPQSGANGYTIGKHVWDIQSGADLTAVEGSFIGWSPDSSLVYWSGPNFSVLSLAVLSLATPAQPQTYGPLPVNTPYPASVVWNPNGPLLAQRPFDWSIQGEYPTCVRCFGLSLQDPVTGAVRTVLDASAGMIDIVSMRPVLGFMLVWARTCLGLYNTVCSYSLMRVDLTEGTARTVAVSASELPIAVSPDYQSVAIAASGSGGIYVKSLAP